MMTEEQIQKLEEIEKADFERVIKEIVYINTTLREILINVAKEGITKEKISSIWNELKKRVDLNDKDSWRLEDMLDKPEDYNDYDDFIDCTIREVVESLSELKVQYIDDRHYLVKSLCPFRIVNKFEKSDDFDKLEEDMLWAWWSRLEDAILLRVGDYGHFERDVQIIKYMDEINDDLRKCFDEQDYGKFHDYEKIMVDDWDIDWFDDTFYNILEIKDRTERLATAEDSLENFKMDLIQYLSEEYFHHSEFLMYIEDVLDVDKAQNVYDYGDYMKLWNDRRGNPILSVEMDSVPCE